MQTISIDVGRNEVKATNGKDSVVFKSIVGSYHILDVPSHVPNYDVIVNNQKYFVADLARVESKRKSRMVTKSKVHNETKILLLTALQLLADPQKPFQIVTGMPINQYSVKCKNDLMEFVAGTHTISVNGITSTFEINNSNFKMAQESVGSYWNEVCDDKGNEIDPHGLLIKKVRVIDIGSRTVNYSTIDCGNYINTESGSLNYGTIEITKDAPSNEFDYDAIKESFVRTIVADISQEWTDYEDDTFLLTGGGATLLERFILGFYKKSIMSEDPKMANAKGYYKMLVGDSD